MNNEIILTEETIDEIINNAKPYGIVLLKHIDENNTLCIYVFGHGETDFYLETTGKYKFIFTDTTIDIAVVSPDI